MKDIVYAWKNFYFLFWGILKSIEKIRRYLGKASFYEFLKNEMLIDSVIRNLEIIGAATAYVPPETHIEYPEIEWKKVWAWEIS